MLTATLRSQDGMFALCKNKLDAVQVQSWSDEQNFMNRCCVMSTKYYVVVMFSGQRIIVGKFRNKEDAVDVMNKIIDCRWEAMDYQVPEDLSNKED